MRVDPRALALLLLLPAGGCGGLASVSRIVLVTLDTTRADRLGCYGHAAARTPQIDALAEESVLFEHAVSPASTTLPAHATIFTGQYPQDHGIRYNLFYRLKPEARTLAEALKAQGYATAALPASQIVSSDFGLQQGFDTYADPPEKPDPDPDHPVAGIDRTAAQGVDLALDWLAAHPGERLFLWLHLYDPHGPYAPPFPYSSEFKERPYDGELAYADAQLGRLLTKLRQDRAWKKTLLIVVGDHGEGLYEHGERWHSMLTYESTQHVPLLVRAPGSRARRVPEAVTLADLMPTILDLARVPPPPEMRGLSLRPVLEGGASAQRELYFESLAGSLIYGWQELRGIRSGRWKLIDSAQPELYDLEQDPGEQNNVASLEPERLSELREALGELEPPMTSSQGRSESQAARLDPETEARLASLGYVGSASGSAVSEGAPHPRTMIHLEPELLSAQGAVARRDWPYVEDLCRYTLGLDRTNKWALIHMSWAQLRQQRLEPALQHAELAIKLYPDSEQGYKALAEIYVAKGQQDRSYDVLQQGLAVLPQSELLSYLSLVAAFDTGRESVCPDEVNQSVALHPDSSRIQVMKARCAVREGDPKTALEALEEAVRLGFKHLDVVEQAQDFAALVTTPEFRKLQELVKQKEKEKEKEEQKKEEDRRRGKVVRAEA